LVLQKAALVVATGMEEEPVEIVEADLLPFDEEHTEGETASVTCFSHTMEVIRVGMGCPLYLLYVLRGSAWSVSFLSSSEFQHSYL
jgi:hypothetical protein